jgi:hypothetical protein
MASAAPDIIYKFARRDIFGGEPRIACRSMLSEIHALRSDKSPLGEAIEGASAFPASRGHPSAALIVSLCAGLVATACYFIPCCRTDENYRRHVSADRLLTETTTYPAPILSPINLQRRDAADHKSLPTARSTY